MKWIIITTVFFFIGRTDTFSQGTYNIGAGFNPKQEDLTGYLELIDTLDQHFDFRSPHIPQVVQKMTKSLTQ